MNVLQPGLSTYAPLSQSRARWRGQLVRHHSRAALEFSGHSGQQAFGCHLVSSSGPQRRLFPRLLAPIHLFLHILVGSTAMSTCKQPEGLVYRAPVDWLGNMSSRRLPLSVSARLCRERRYDEWETTRRWLSMKKADECQLPLPVLMIKKRAGGLSTDAGACHKVK